MASAIAERETESCRRSGGEGGVVRFELADSGETLRGARRTGDRKSVV